MQHTEHFKIDKDKQVEMARVCVTYGGKQKCIQDFDVETLRKESI